MSWHRLMPTEEFFRCERRASSWQFVTWRGTTCRGMALLALLLMVSCGGGGGSGGTGSAGTSSYRPTTGNLELRLAWDDSVGNEDGSTLVDLAGYRVYDGPSSGNYEVVTDVGNISEVVLEDLPAGTYYIAVGAYDHVGNESQLSDEIVVQLDE